MLWFAGFLREFFTCQVGEDFSIGLPLSVRPVLKDRSSHTLAEIFISQFSILAQRPPSCAANPLGALCCRPLGALCGRPFRRKDFCLLLPPFPVHAVVEIFLARAAEATDEYLVADGDQTVRLLEGDE